MEFLLRTGDEPVLLTFRLMDLTSLVCIMDLDRAGILQDTAFITLLSTILFLRAQLPAAIKRALRRIALPQADPQVSAAAMK